MEHQRLRLKWILWVSEVIKQFIECRTFFFFGFEFLLQEQILRIHLYLYMHKVISFGLNSNLTSTLNLILHITQKKLWLGNICIQWIKCKRVLILSFFWKFWEKRARLGNNLLWQGVHTCWKYGSSVNVPKLFPVMEYGIFGVLSWKCPEILCRYCVSLQNLFTFKI